MSTPRTWSQVKPEVEKIIADCKDQLVAALPEDVVRLQQRTLAYQELIDLFEETPVELRASGEDGGY